MHHLDTFPADLIGAGFTVLLLLVFGMLAGDDPWSLGKASALSRKKSAGGKVDAPIRAMMMGSDGRLSTSKVTAFCWTIAVIYALATMCAIVIIENGTFEHGLDQLADSYLLLLGGPFAALVLAKGITVTRINNGSLAKPKATNPSISLKDLASNDAGQTDLVDFQFLMFNAVALAYVLVKFSLSPHAGLPNLPAAFAGLTSVSALTYTANKAVAGSTPAITSAAYDAATGRVTVRGLSLGAAQAQVRFDEAAVEVVSSSATEVVFAVPAGTAAGSHAVRVSVPSGTGQLVVETTVVLPAAPAPAG